MTAAAVGLLPAETSGSLIGSVHLADCLELCERVYRAGVRVDMILADLPYGTTACSWDEVIPLEPMWAAFKKIIKPRGAIVLTATDPFSTGLKVTNFDWYKYSWVWIKSNAGDAMNVKNKPMRQHEDVLVFSQGTTANNSPNRMPYYPQGLVRVNKQRGVGNNEYGKHGGSFKTYRPSHHEYVQEWGNYPTTVLRFNNEMGLHPTQKPVDLFRYLIRSYSQVGQLVFDPTCGSGTTALGATIEKRRFICGDSDSGYVDIARDRLRMYSGDVSDLPLFAARPA